MNPDELRQPLLLGAVTAVLVTAVALAALLTGTPVWRSTAVLSIDQPRALAASDDAGIIDKLSRLRFKYVGLVGTDRLAVPVAKRLGEPVQQVRGRLSAEAQLTDLLVRVSGTDDTRAGARRTTEALAAELLAQVKAEQAATGAPPAAQVQLSVVQGAVAQEQIAPGRTRSLAAAVLQGLLAGALAAGVGLGLRRVRQPGTGA